MQPGTLPDEAKPSARLHVPCLVRLACAAAGDSSCCGAVDPFCMCSSSRSLEPRASGQQGASDMRGFLAIGKADDVRETRGESGAAGQSKTACVDSYS